MNKNSYLTGNTKNTFLECHFCPNVSMHYTQRWVFEREPCARKTEICEIFDVTERYRFLCFLTIFRSLTRNNYEVNCERIIDAKSSLYTAVVGSQVLRTRVSFPAIDIVIGIFSVMWFLNIV